jgi:multicomponent Na+:H+ antiporter subunit C
MTPVQVAMDQTHHLEQPPVLLLAIVIGALYAAGLFMMLRKSLIKLLIGLVLISNAANLLIFASSRIIRARPPLVPEGELAPIPPFSDPLAQALILTAIVISFGVLAFALALSNRVADTIDTDNLDRMTSTET